MLIACRCDRFHLSFEVKSSHLNREGGPMSQYKSSAVLCLALLLAIAVPQAAQAGFVIGPDAQNYALLFEGAGANTLQITNVTVNGNVGVGLTGKATDSGPSTINGRIDFAAANTGQFGNNNASDVITGGV